MSSANAMMRFENVGVSYRKNLSLFKPERHWALRGVSFTVMHGETLGIIGKNGAGKSTLMKLMAGIISPDEGSVWCEAKSVQLLALQVGFLPHLTGRENAIMSGILLGLRKKDVISAMDDIIEFSELGKQIDDPVRTYSAGMRARLGFAVAKQTDPEVLLIDEALSVGDASFRKKSKAVMANRIASDKTVVIVSHNEAMLHEYCDRVIWLDAGKAREIGDTESVIKSYEGKLTND